MKQLSILKMLALSLGLTACASQPMATNQPAKPTILVYPSQSLYFHYFSLDVPQDIDLDKAVIEAGFWGNQFFAYPIESQQAFTDLVNRRINLFKKHKLSEKALAYEKEGRADLIYATDDVRASFPKLNMTTALYKAIKYDDNRYKIIANSTDNLDATFQSSMYNQYYMYVPEQHKYIMTPQIRQPAKFLVTQDPEISGRKFLDTQIRPLSKQALTNPKVMAVGPVAWLQPESHPDISYKLTSKSYPIEIDLETRGYSKYDGINETQKQQIDQLKSSNATRAITSGSREAGGIKGQERCYQVSPSTYRPHHQVYCTWGTDGKPEDLDHPYINIALTYTTDGSETQTKQAMATWEQLLGSLKKRGHS